MASSPIHLAIAKKVLEKENNLDRRKVLAGALYPDTVQDKNKSHYADLTKRGKNNVSHLAGKVNLYSFLLEHENLTDFEFGWFLHLVTDYLFFDECFTREYLLTHSYETFRKDLYFAYDCLCEYLIEKYGITMEDYTDYRSEFYPGTGYQECIFSKELIDSFINRVSTIDYNKYVKKIRQAKINVKP